MQPKYEDPTNMLNEINNEHFPEFSTDALGDQILNTHFIEKDFQNPKEILENIQKFWSLAPLTQQKYAENFPLIFEKLTIQKYELIVKTVFTHDSKLIKNNVETIKILLKELELLQSRLITFIWAV